MIILCDVCIQGDICCVRYTVDVQETESIERAQNSVSSSADCPVCLGECTCSCPHYWVLGPILSTTFTSYVFNYIFTFWYCI
jgi:hypothetical protein